METETTLTLNPLILFIKFLIWYGLNNMKLGYRRYIYVGYLSTKSWENEKIMVNTRDSINTLVSWVHSLMLLTYIRRLEIYIFFRAKYSVVWQNSQWVHAI